MAAIITQGAVSTAAMTGGIMDIEQQSPSLSLEGLIQALNGNTQVKSIV